MLFFKTGDTLRGHKMAFISEEYERVIPKKSFMCELTAAE
jgi:hypothetical protein